MSTYNHYQIEEKWAKKWYENNLYEAIDFSEKPKKYILAEFPYPSGKALHAGHMMRYTVPDVYARFLRMSGFNVMYPMGWDAFGLPAENYAIKTGTNPAVITNEIISHYKNSIKKMGYGIDWNREIKTTDPKYYKWTQWIFLKLHKAGLAEYKEMPIWWCNELKTVLADEEVLTDKEGNKISERGEKPVERKLLKQWVLKMPQYADKLLQGLDEVDFDESIKLAQRNWIGKSVGALVNFKINNEQIKVFTTRPDTIYGATFLVFAPDHDFIQNLLNKISNKQQVIDYINITKNKSDLERQTNKEKTGVKLEGINAIHPLTNQEIPIYIADYVLKSYGTGSIMAVPAHDERDLEFAEKFALPVIQVIDEENNMINSDKYNGMNAKDFMQKTLEIFEPKTTYKIRDWVFSRQRYWGEPIPLIHKNNNIKPICDPDDLESVNKTLPLELPEVPDYNPTDDGTSPLERNKEWVKVDEDTKRETNTMPNWAGSCWYYLRYCDPHNEKQFADPKKLKYWLPVDRYFGGAEHTTMHLLYSRFWHKFLYDQKQVPTSEPYQWRMNGGLLLGPDGKKMSKSKGNVIEPIDIVEKQGADALRMFICFLGPYTDTYPWNDNGVKATNKLMHTLYELKNKTTDTKQDQETIKLINKTTKNITSMLEDLKINTCVSELMILINKLKKQEKISLETYKTTLKLFAPFAPFITEELWQEVNNYEKWSKSNSIHVQPWPSFDEKLAADENIILPVQINGKVRAELEIAVGTDQETVVKLAKDSPKISEYLDNKQIKKTIFVKDKILNFVI